MRFLALIFYKFLYFSKKIKHKTGLYFKNNNIVKVVDFFKSLLKVVNYF